MSTRSSIAIKHGDRIKSIYCHSDGYLAYNGRVLLENYSDSVKVSKLISMGDMSVLGKEIGEQISFNDRMVYDDADGYAQQCRFYGRDRGEEGVEFKSFDGEDTWVNFYNDCEYFYLYDHGVWYVKAYRGKFKPLHEEVAKEIAEQEETR